MSNCDIAFIIYIIFILVIVGIFIYQEYFYRRCYHNYELKLTKSNRMYWKCKYCNKKVNYLK